MEPKGHEGAHKHVELSKILGVLRICGTQQSPCTPPPPPRKSSAIQFFFQRQLSSLQQHYPDHRHYIDYSKSSLLIVNCAQTSCPSASCPPSGTSYLYPEQLRHQKADKDECKHCRTIAGKYRETNPKKLSLCLYFAGYKASE